MGAVEVVAADWMHEAEFFAPASSDLVTGLMGEYRRARGWIEEASAFFEGEPFKAVIGYFLDGNSDERRGRSMMASSAAQMFDKEGALRQLDAAYWAKAMALTDVYNLMPQKRREEWNEMIRNPQGIKKSTHEVSVDRANAKHLFDSFGRYINQDDEWKVRRIPEFEEATVRATLEDLLMSRSKFFAEKVDGIFRALSGEHVTNTPQGFGKRMILTNITSTYYAHERTGYINDLRGVIAKFMGRDEPEWNSSSAVVMEARKRRGEWLSIDGNALRLRCYLNGNAHLEVHPDMAWRLNCVLAQMHPSAIPAEFRQRPKKKAKEFAMIHRPLPFAVLSELERLEPAYKYVADSRSWSGKGRELVPNAVSFRYGDFDKNARNEAEAILASLGGVLTKERDWQFDYDPMPVIKDVAFSGCVPDVKAHQYYPTPERLACEAVELAQIGPDHECLEPSAGTGGLASLMPQERTLCVEISDLHCKVLEAKGFEVQRGDFLQWAASYPRSFDRIVMNPPFSEGRWQAHLEHAAGLLRDGGRLVAILPASAKNRDVLPGWSLQWSRVIDGAFSGASVSVVILAAVR